MEIFNHFDDIPDELANSVEPLNEAARALMPKATPAPKDLRRRSEFAINETRGSPPSEHER
jgi:hypothetical protein